MRKQAQISPPPFFCGCRLSAAAAGSHPTDDGKIHRCRRRSAVENVFKAITALHTGTGTGTVGTDVSRGTKKQAINNLEMAPAAAKSTVAARVGCPGCS
ncbi:hypothetical protein K0B56_22260, partial [Salmonella enterica subsp. enterica serovar Give]|nr:hypothetical protein [Salmonella enterica subsp. enterica serovar Give]